MVFIMVSPLIILALSIYIHIYIYIYSLYIGDVKVSPEGRCLELSQ